LFTYWFDCSELKIIQERHTEFYVDTDNYTYYILPQFLGQQLQTKRYMNSDVISDKLDIMHNLYLSMKLLKKLKQ
jgi:hypothetical protein